MAEIAGALEFNADLFDREFGPGTVSVVEAERVTVLFEDRGYVTLDTQISLDSELLVPVAS